MKFPIFLLLILAFTTGRVAAAPPAHGKAHHVVVMVWDGMRPDFVTEKTTPNLWKLSCQGVTFLNNHPVYISVTEANGTAMATGVYPERSDVMADREYRPLANPLDVVGTEQPATIQAAKGPYIGAPTVVQMLHKAGLQTAIAGTKGIALLQDWSHDGASPASRASILFYAGKTAPPEAMAQLTGTLGAWPQFVDFPNISEDTWTTQALTQVLWKKAVPAYSMLWMSDPDYSQHQMDLGSQIALAAIKSADDRLGTVLGALDKKGVRDDTDIFIISDHGFSTLLGGNDILTPLAADGLMVTGTALAQPPKNGQVMAVGGGGCVLFYIIGHDEAIGRKLVESLQKLPSTGVIFSRWEIPGSFDLHTAHIATRDAPDVVMSFTWTAARNMDGTPGMVQGDWSRKKNKGTHGSLSRFEMHNTLIAAGPDFKQGWSDVTSSGNIDLAPTILWILGVPQAVPMDGRVLREAMIDGGSRPEESERVLWAGNPATHWQQYLKVNRVGTTEYIDEGNRGAGP